ncbi:hypothetical protein HYY69_04875 [Candidatus Woesearchaeota archaeon]|nr:hypothetical protein [Candidatus Woesearchaeota archaeon]
MDSKKICALSHTSQNIAIKDIIAKILGAEKTMTIHAHGLNYPSHMEWTADGRLLVSEFLGGTVKDITVGGDCRTIKPFAFNFGHPASILTNYKSNRIIVVDNGRGKIYDITAGGNAEKAPVVFSGIPGPYGLVAHDGKVYSTFSNSRENGLVKVDEGKSFSDDLILTRGFPRGVRETPDARMEGVEIGDCGSWSARSVGDRLLYLHSGLGIIFDLEHDDEKVRHHRCYSTNIPIVAQGLYKPLGFTSQQINGQDVLFVAERFGHDIKVIPPDEYGVDMRYIPPVVTGFREPSCLRFSPSNLNEMYVCDFAAGVVWKITFKDLLEK